MFFLAISVTFFSKVFEPWSMRNILSKSPVCWKYNWIVLHYFSTANCWTVLYELYCNKDIRKHEKKTKMNLYMTIIFFFFFFFWIEDRNNKPFVPSTSNFADYFLRCIRLKCHWKQTKHLWRTDYSSLLWSSLALWGKRIDNVQD